MPNIASVLKAEIVRLARKELRGEVDALKKSLSASRTEMASLKRKVGELEQSLKQALKQAARSSPDRTKAASSADALAESGQFRFRAAGMATNRMRLGLSAADFGLLIGASGQSVYAWEQGKARPRGKNLAAIAALRGIGKREAMQRLAMRKDAERPRAG